MRATLFALLVLAVASLGFAAARRSPAARVAAASATEAADLEDFAFLSGSWQCQRGDARVEEHWTLPAGGTLLGMGRTVTTGAHGTTKEFEYTRVEATKSGFDYVAQPGGQPPTRFHCTSLVGRKAVFENAAHDFPTKITYERVDDATLVATVSGPAGATEKSVEFRYTKAGEAVRLPD